MGVFIKNKMCIQLSAENCAFYLSVWRRKGKKDPLLLHMWLFNFCKQSHAPVCVAEMLQAVYLPLLKDHKKDRKSALVLNLKPCLFVYLCPGWTDGRTQSWSIGILWLAAGCCRAVFVFQVWGGFFWGRNKWSGVFSANGLFQEYVWALPVQIRQK